MKIILFLFSVLLFTSCGQDVLNKKSVTTGTGSTGLGSNECVCTMEYAPVCGNDGKSYENKCIMGCMGATLKFAGNCSCNENVKVCGTDNQNYNECEAKNAGIAVKYYGVCGTGTL